jgi:hypothetical protein
MKSLIGRTVIKYEIDGDGVYLEFDDGSKLHAYNGYSPLGGHFDMERYFQISFTPGPTGKELGILAEKREFEKLAEKEKAEAYKKFEKWKKGHGKAT